MVFKPTAVASNKLGKLAGQWHMLSC